MALLLPCPGCSRHVRVSERRCPFCDAPVPQMRPSGLVLTQPLSRSAQLVWKVTLGGAALIACSSVGEGPSVVDPVRPPVAEEPDASPDDQDADPDAPEAEAHVRRSMVPIYTASCYKINDRPEFKLHSVQPTNDIDGLLSLIARVLGEHPDFLLEIRGHADPSEGSRAKWLSKERALLVQKGLLEQGLPASQLVVKSFGAKYPIEGMPPERNTRVDFFLFGRRTCLGMPPTDGGTDGD